MPPELDDWGQPIEKPPWRPDSKSPDCMFDTFPDQAERDRRGDEAKKIRMRLYRRRCGLEEDRDGGGEGPKRD